MSSLPSPTGYDVYWEKWIDAFEEDTETQLEDHEETALEGGFFDEESFSEEEAFTESVSHIQSIITPFGIMPITEQNRASTYFKLWVGHSNFKLTEDFYKIIGREGGVEALDILTPYRFRIAVGKMFVDRNVMKAVRDKMVLHVSDKLAK
jgi:hypothetical protein